MQQRRVGTAVREHRLVGVAGDDCQLGARRQHPHQAGGLRVEVLGVVDEQQLDSPPLGGEQLVRRRRTLPARRRRARPRRARARWPAGRPCRRRTAAAWSARTAARTGPRRAIPGGPTTDRCVAAQRDPRRVRCSVPAGRAARWRTRRCSTRAAAGAARRRRRRSPSSRSPASSSRMMPSCSAVVISRGGGSPLRCAASLSTAKAYECTVRTSGSRIDRATTGLQQRGSDRGAGPRAEPCRTRQQQNGFRIGAVGDVRGRGLDQRAGLAGTGAAEHTHDTANTGLGQRRRSETVCGADMWA